MDFIFWVLSLNYCRNNGYIETFTTDSMGARDHIDINVTISLDLLLRDDNLAGVTVLGVGDWVIHDTN